MPGDQEPDNRETTVSSLIGVTEFVKAAISSTEASRLAPGQYAERPRSRPSSSGAALATAIRHVVGQPFSPEERLIIIECFQDMQRSDTGVFDDPSRATPTKRLNLPLFGWIIRSLSMLGVKPEHPTKFLRRWDDAEELIWWLGLLEWQRASRQESLRVMNIGVPRINALKNGTERLERSVRSLLNWLVTHQDRASGLWGPGQGGGLSEGLGATFHIMVLFEAAGRRAPMGDRITSTILDLWREEDGWGDAWANMAALSVLSKAAADAEEVDPKAADLAFEAARILVPRRAGSGTHILSAMPLSDALTRLEGLRAAAKLSKHPDLDECREWRSAWDPKLWDCVW